MNKIKKSRFKRQFLERFSGLRQRSVIGAAAMLGLAAAGPEAAAAALIADPQDIGDQSGDIRTVRARVQGDYMIFNMSVEGVAAPTIEQTAEGMVNRYYYHWLLDTDNNPATGRSNSEYEGTPTGVTNPVGAERVVMVGWREGKVNGLAVYDPLDEENPKLLDFPYLASGNSLTAIVPLSALGVVTGQTVAVSAFQEGASEDWTVDWAESALMTVEGPTMSIGTVTDPVDDLGDPSGDLKEIGGYVLGDHLFLWMTTEGAAMPSVANTTEGMVNRYYYHWLLDTDNNPATGRSNAEYEGNPTGLTSPVGTERVIQAGWRDGKPDGIEIYDPLDDENAILSGYSFQVGGNTISAMIPLSALGVTRGQTVALSAFQEGASEDWLVDWMESTRITAEGPNPPIAAVADPTDMGDTSGDIRRISAHVVADELHLSMTVEGVAAPSLEGTPEGMANRYYYHWLLDTDNNPATGRSNAEYEGTPTGLSNPVGADVVIQVGWRDGKPNGIAAYNPADEDNPLAVNFPFRASGNTISAEIPLSQLGLTAGQTVALSAFQEGASEDWKVDWMESETLDLDAGAAAEAPVAAVDDPQDIGDSSGDIKRIEATVAGGNLVLRMSAHGKILPLADETPEGMVNRYYYHWLIDTDNNPATGRSNAEYEGTPTGVVDPIGAERVVMLGWRNGAVEGREVYDPLDEENPLISDFEYTLNNGVVEVRLPMSELGLIPGQTVAISAFQEGASEDWTVDWLESAVLTLSEGSLPTLSLEAVFTGDASGFEIQLTDKPPAQADVTSIQVELDGNPVAADISNAGGVTKIVGQHSSLLQAGTVHTVSLSLNVSGELQSRNFVFEVAPYTVLPLTGRLQSGDANARGFILYMTAIGSSQTLEGGPSVHSNLAVLAEMQLKGELMPEGSETPYINEADFTQAGAWKGEAIAVPGVINWYELAPESTSLNFGNDEPVPNVTFPGEGVVAELQTYLELPAGTTKLGLYTEGGHKVTAGFDPAGPVISVFDNSGDIERVPSYFSRNQFFDVVAPQAGLYPIRVLWFQSRRGQEQGLLLEFFTVKDRALHLVNDNSDPLAIKAYRSGTPAVDAPVVSVNRGANGVTLTWTGRLESSDRIIGGTWTVIGEANESPKTIQPTGGAAFFRARQN